MNQIKRFLLKRMKAVDSFFHSSYTFYEVVTMSKQEYIAIIGDIHDSRLIENREETQKQLLESLKQVNKKYQKELASKFSISMGDSFQGLLDLNAPFMEIILDIELALLPVEIRFGIGIGEIATAIDSKNSQLNDGPAYHRARRTIEWIEQSEQQYATRKTNILLLSEQNETKSDRLINAIFALNTAIKSKWSDRQKEIIKAYLENNENQYDTAHALDIGQSSVSKSLKSTNFYTYKAAIEDVQNYMYKKAEGEMDNV